MLREIIYWPCPWAKYLVYTASNKTEAFAKIMKGQIQPNDIIADEDHIKLEHFLNEYFAWHLNVFFQKFYLQEVRTVIIRDNLSKSPRLDSINARCLKAAPYTRISIPI